MQEMKPIKEGKVREIYDNGDSHDYGSNRPDQLLRCDSGTNVVTKKGTVLTQMSKFWFNLTKDILPNHMISTDVKDMPEFFQQERFDGNSMMCKKLVINAGIREVIVRETPDTFTVYDVSAWIEDDDSMTGKFGY